MVIRKKNDSVKTDTRYFGFYKAKIKLILHIQYSMMKGTQKNKNEQRK